MEFNTKKFDAVVELQKQLWASAVSRLENTQVLISFDDPGTVFLFQHSSQNIAFAGATRVCYRAGLVFVSKIEEWDQAIKHELVHTVLARMQNSNRDSSIGNKNGKYKSHGEAFYLMHKILWGTNGDKYLHGYITRNFTKAKEAVKLFNQLGIKGLRRYEESCANENSMCEGFIS
jgi:hypothetical protein